MTDDVRSDEDLARERARYLASMVWHLGAFVIINMFFWLLDLGTGAPGLQWAPWITLFWGFAVLFHVLAWIVDGRQLERRLTQRYLDEERRTVAH